MTTALFPSARGNKNLNNRIQNPGTGIQNPEGLDYFSSQHAFPIQNKINREALLPSKAISM
ncbi:MAG: hypothetical protein MUE70_09965, partial [Desulfobacterales bacterium]|nr:hypothetical protein [Desulfobacterales bacterium]